jgi:hypothetical protein
MSKCLERELIVLAVTLVAMLVPAVNCSGAFAQSSDRKPGNAGTKFLHGSVEHSDQLAPVQSGLQVGTTFDATKLEQGSATRTWYRVPPWFAGKWQYDDYTTTFSQDYKTGSTNPQARTHPAVASETWGCQRDRLGGIWDFFAASGLSETTSEEKIWKDMTTDESLIFDSDTKLIRRSVSTRTTVDKTNNTILSVSQFECFSTYTMYGDKVKTEYSMKEFDDQGKPKLLSQGWRIGSRLAPFIVDNYRHKEDVRPSFLEYLKSHDLQKLVPLDQ